jgi:hypothetical protein
MSSAKDRLNALASAFVNKNNSAGGNQTPVWKKFYQFWKMPDNTTAVIRFLPDRDEDSNPLKFLVENLTHQLVVNGQKKTVPCLSMYGEACPICEHSQKLYAENNEEMGKKYYKKRSYIGQVLVTESPFEYQDEKDENPGIVKLIDFGPKIFKCIQTAFQSGDLEEAPYEYRGGYNFRIKKTKAGQWSDYGTSSFAPKQTDLDEEVIDAVKAELHSLSEYREKYVTRAALEAMLLADQTGAAMNESQDSSDAPAKSESNGANAEKAETASSTSSEAAASDDTGASTKAKSVLEQLRARAAAKKADAE